MPESRHPTGDRAVFLSYAHEDAVAAQRIAEALRSFGIEVWFDQNELRGGDAWDAKIRKEIKDCALFLPLISVHTQARREGYFRREWKLAVDRTHDMDEALPFLLPIVIDSTRDAEAFVPSKFRDVQWTRLPGGETPATFCAHVQTLLDEEIQRVTHERAATISGAERSRSTVTGSSPPRQRRWTLPVSLFLIVAAIAAGYWNASRSRALGDSDSRVNAKIPAPETPSEARKLAAKADALFDQEENAVRETLALAEQFCKQAIALDPNDAGVWAITSRMHSNHIWLTFDRSQERRTLAGDAATRAVRLASESFEARYALAYFYRLEDATYLEAERILRKLTEEQPGDKRVWRTLGQTLRQATILPGRSRGREEEAVACLRKAASLPGGDPLALLHLATTLATLGRLDEAEEAIDGSIALRKATGSTNKVNLLLRFRGDVGRAREALARVPVERLREDFGAFLAAQVWWCAREPDKVVEALRVLPRDYLEAAFDGPKGLLVGQAHAFAGRPQAAQIEWRAALKLIETRIASQSNNVRLRVWQSWLLACLGERAEAERVFQTAEQLGLSARDAYWAAAIPLELGDREKAISLLAAALRDPVVVTRAFLRINPAWDALRIEPRFQALLREPERSIAADKGQGSAGGQGKQ